MKQSLSARIGILSIATLNLASLFISPIMGLIVAAFSGKELNSIQLIISISNLTALFAAIAVGRLAMNISTKSIALGGVGLIAVFGLLPYLIHFDVWVLVVFAGLVGVGTGTLSNILPALIAENFPVEQRQGMLGLQTVFASVGMMVFSLLAGKLGTSSWFSAYLVYAAAIVVFILALFTLPSHKNNENNHRANTREGIKEVLNPTVIILGIIGFMFMLVCSAYNVNYSLIIHQNNLGGSDVSGIISTVGQIGGLLAGLGVGAIAKKSRNYMLIITFTMITVGLTIGAFVPVVWAQAVASFLINAAMSFYFASAPFMMTVLVQPVFIPLAMAVLNIFNSLGGFVSPYIVNGINSFFGSRATGALAVCAVLAAVTVAVLIMTNFQKKGFEKAIGLTK
ncbi:MFS transporter [Alloscardovia theropitheci]|uniref:MFS transporter n=1 Tax=Alloscardovia theropitheci TaxID=2496842 RepID=A0A4R0QPG2_9BIFI|nr:MFS transporter [Alloscardovia theropitheci]TCD54104.1 MFS transporter [Alloscardovia theropitheci]